MKRRDAKQENGVKLGFSTKSKTPVNPCTHFVDINFSLVWFHCPLENAKIIHIYIHIIEYLYFTPYSTLTQSNFIKLYH
jgi:hypothetical protein